MMSLLFLLIFIVFLLIHIGRRPAAMGLFFVSLLLSAFWFWHHATLKLDLHF